VYPLHHSAPQRCNTILLRCALKTRHCYSANLYSIHILLSWQESCCHAGLTRQVFKTLLAEATYKLTKVHGIKSNRTEPIFGENETLQRQFASLISQLAITWKLWSPNRQCSCLCMYICICVCMHVCMYIYIYIYIHTHINYLLPYNCGLSVRPTYWLLGLLDWKPT